MTRTCRETEIKYCPRDAAGYGGKGCFIDEVFRSKVAAAARKMRR